MKYYLMKKRAVQMRSHSAYPPAKLTDKALPRRHRLLRKHDHRCFLCDLHLAYEDYTDDHLFPRSRGGSNAEPNLVPAHKSCNNEKSDRWPTEEELERFFAIRGHWPYSWVTSRPKSPSKPTDLPPEFG